MIWIPNEQLRECGSEALRQHIRCVMEENGVNLSSWDDEQVDALSHAVAMRVKEDGQSGMYVQSGYLVMLASRALFSIGEKQAAHRMLVFGTGLVKPSEWCFRGGQSVWTLDLGRMTVRQDVLLELVFFNSLHRVLDCVADVWDVHDGRGTLGLRGLETAVDGVLPQGKKSLKFELQKEVSVTCRLKLKQLHESRGWQYTPDVVNVDL